MANIEKRKSLPNGKNWVISILKCIVPVLLVMVAVSCGGKPPEKTISENGVILGPGVDGTSVRDITNYYKIAEQNNTAKTVDKIIPYFSPDFRGQAGESLASLAGSMKKFHESGRKVSYQVSEIHIFTAGENSFISRNKYKTVLTEKNGKTRSVSGKEKLVWEKKNGNLRIVYWETR